MKFRRICSVALAVSILTASSAIFTASAKETTDGRFGDVNLDGRITVDDIAALTNEEYTCSDDTLLKIADINGDGKVDSADADKYVDCFITAGNNMGDANSDGNVTVDDATTIQKYIANISDELDFVQLLSSDFNNDGKISIDDTTEIQKYIAGSVVSDFPSYSVKKTDEKYRKEYAEYITPTIEKLTKNCYFVWSDDPDYAIYFRDSKWLYQYIGNPGTIHPERRGLKVLGTYVSDKNIILPSKTEGGVAVDGVGCASGTVLENAGAKPFHIAGDQSLIGYASYGPGIELNSVIIPNNYVVESGVFQWNMTLKYVFMASNVTLYSYCFYECPSLVSVKLSNTLEKIPNNAFQGCRYLDRIAIPDSVKNIDHGAFIGCALKEITLSRSVANIGGSAFLNCPLEKVYVYNSVADIGAAAFYNRSYGTNGNINPNCKFYGYKNSTLEEWLKEIKDSFADWGVKVTYDFTSL